MYQVTGIMRSASNAIPFGPFASPAGFCHCEAAAGGRSNPLPSVQDTNCFEVSPLAMTRKRAGLSALRDASFYASSILLMVSLPLTQMGGMPMTLAACSVSGTVSFRSSRSSFHFRQPAMSCFSPTPMRSTR